VIPHKGQNHNLTLLSLEIINGCEAHALIKRALLHSYLIVGTRIDTRTLVSEFVVSFVVLKTDRFRFKQVLFVTFAQVDLCVLG
jgi:hypothetical protein